MERLHKKIVLTGTINLVTGLHIGDSNDTVEIGGIDLPVVRKKIDDIPYLPGSSIKGKMRSLLEQAYGANMPSEFKEAFKQKEYNGKASEIWKLFGSRENISRLLVRDASMETGSAKKFKSLKTTDYRITEVKWENSIDRVKGTAEHPRQIERIPAGALFNIEFVINIFAEESTASEIENMQLKTFQNAFSLLLDDYLGGHGSRGYGQIELVDKKLFRKDNEYLLDKEGELSVKLKVQKDEIKFGLCNT